MSDPEISDYIIRVSRALYLSSVRALDVAIGKIINHLEKTDKLKDTILVYASDNGAATENFQSAGSYR